MLIAPALTLHSNPNLMPDDNSGLYKAGGALVGIALLIYGIRKYSGNSSSGESEQAAAYAKRMSFSPDPGVTCYRYYSQLSCVKN